MVEKNKDYERFLEIFNSLDKSKISVLQQYMQRFAVNFNLYKDDSFLERTFPFDPIPRIIPKDEFEMLERGLKQRVYALNEFLNDIYGEQKIVKEKIIPAEFIYSAKGFLPRFMGTKTNKNIRTHICGIDLVKDATTNRWVILEDNLRVPSGASYPLSIRQSYRKVYPELFEKMKIEKIKQYPQVLSKMFDYVNPGGINVVLTPGRFNSAFYEHSYLAKETGAKLVRNEDLKVVGDKLFLQEYDGNLTRVGTVYRRLDDDFLDPLEFNPQSLLGVPNIANVYRNQNVSIVNSIGNGVADDKGIYYFVDKMIKFYLNETPILDIAPTYLPYFEKDKKYILENMEKLVIKDVAEAGGYGVLFGYKLTQEQLKQLKIAIEEDPRRFIAQELVEFYDIDCLVGEHLAPRKSDLRAYVVYGEEIEVFKGGLTRFSMIENNYLVNSSQGGGFKDTWIMGE